MIKPPRTYLLAAPSAGTEYAGIYEMLPESVSLNQSFVGPEIWNVCVVPLPGAPASLDFVGSGGIPTRVKLRERATASPFISNLSLFPVETLGDLRLVCSEGAAVVMFNAGDGDEAMDGPFQFGMQVSRQIQNISRMRRRWDGSTRSRSSRRPSCS